MEAGNSIVEIRCYFSLFTLLTYTSIIYYNTTNDIEDTIIPLFIALVLGTVLFGRGCPF